MQEIQNIAYIQSLSILFQKHSLKSFLKLKKHVEQTLANQFHYERNCSISTSWNSFLYHIKRMNSLVKINNCVLFLLDKLKHSHQRVPYHRKIALGILHCLYFSKQNLFHSQLLSSHIPSLSSSSSSSLSSSSSSSSPSISSSSMLMCESNAKFGNDSKRNHIFYNSLIHKILMNILQGVYISNGNEVHDDNDGSGSGDHLNLEKNIKNFQLWGCQLFIYLQCNLPQIPNSEGDSTKMVQEITAKQDKRLPIIFSTCHSEVFPVYCIYSSNDLQNFMKILYHIIKNTSRIVKNQKHATRLSVTAADLFLLILFHSSKTLSTKVGGTDEFDISIIHWIINLFIDVLDEMILWNKIGNQLLFVESLTLLKEMVKKLEETRKYLKDQNKLEILCRGYSILCQSFVPFMLQDMSIFLNQRNSNQIQNNYFSPLITISTSLLLQIKQENDDKKQNHTNEEEIVTYLLILSMISGKYSQEILSETVAPKSEETIESLIWNVVTSFFYNSYKDKRISHLAIQLLKHLIDQKSNAITNEVERKYFMESLLLSLWDMLKRDISLEIKDNRNDMIDNAICTLIADIMSRYPTYQFLFEKIDDLSSQETAINILKELWKRSFSETSPNFKDIQIRITDYLLSRLDDEDLQMRLDCAELLKHLDYKLIIPKLFSKLIFQHDHRIQSATYRALLSLLHYHCMKYPNDISSIALFILDYCVNQFSTEYQKEEQTPPLISIFHKPSDINPINKVNSSKNLDEKKTIISEKTASLIEQIEWNKYGTKYTCECFLQELVKRIFSHPNESLYILAMNKISGVPHFIHSHMDIVIPMIIKRLKEAINIENTTKPTIFELLSPLLILRTFPVEIFLQKKNDEFNTLQSFLLQFMECKSNILTSLSDSENKSIQKLSSDLYARFALDNTLPLILDRFKGFVTCNKLAHAKVYLYCLCQVLLIHDADVTLKYRENFVPFILDHMLNKDSTEFNDHEFEKIQQGARDCIAFLIRSELISKKNSHGKHSYYLDSFIDEFFSTQQIERTARHLNLIQSFTIGCRSYLSLSQIQDLAQYSMKPCLNYLLISTTTPSHSSLEFQVGSFQYLLNLVYHLKNAIHPYSSLLIQLIHQQLVPMTGLSKLSQQARSLLQLSALKLLSGVLVAREDILQDYSIQCSQILQYIQQFSQFHENKHVRQLSHQLITLLTKGSFN